MLELKNINLSFDKIIIKNSDLIIKDRQITVISGESGKGKTSLLTEICMLTHHATMDYYINGCLDSKMTYSQINSFKTNAIAFVTQKPCLIQTMSVRENLYYTYNLCEDKTFDDDIVKLFEYLNLHVSLDSLVKDLSGGEQQRLSIICSIVKSTPIIVMDEPTAYIDKDNVDSFINLLKILRDKYDKTIVIATHDHRLIDMCDVHYHIDECYLVKVKDSHLSFEYIDWKLRVKKITKFYYLIMHFIKINKNMYRLFNILLSLLLIICTFVFSYIDTYSLGIKNEIENMQSHQIVVVSKREITPNIINKIKKISGVKDVFPYNYIITNDYYAISPYISEDYFKNYIYKELSHSTSIVANYNVYREHDDGELNISIQNNNLSLDVNSYLDHMFVDYTVGCDFAKVVYVPYDLYLSIASNEEEVKTHVMLVSLDSKEEYNRIIDEIGDLNAYLSIYNDDKRIELINIYSGLMVFKNYILIFICVLMVLCLLIVKFICGYRWRLDLLWLQINSRNKIDLYKLNVIKEIKESYRAFVSSFIVVNILLFFTRILDLRVISYVGVFFVGVFIINLLFGHFILFLYLMKSKTEKLIKIQ